LVLRYGTRLVLVLLPKTFQELLTTTRAVFGAETTSTFVFETSDLDVCQDAAVEIHPAAWEAIALTVSTVVVKKKDSVTPRGKGGVDGVVVLQHPHMRRKSSLTPKRVHIAASGSSNDVIQSESGLGASATSYDDIQDSVPTDDFAEEELVSHDDDFDVTPARRMGKNKTRSRPRIESDDEPGDADEEGYVEALPVVKLPPSHRMRNVVEPSFSIVPSSSKRISTPPKTVRGSRGLFSPVRVRSGLFKAAPPPALSDEEKWETKPPRANVAVVPETVLNLSPQKDAQKDDFSTQSKTKPQLNLQATSALATPPAPPVASDKLLITIRHPPTEKENKFKVKATHTVGRVLSSACVAFGLDANGASLMLWSEDDGVEMSYLCENHLSMGSIATDGTVFTIELAK
jgi:hypothetical protein